MRHAKFFVAFDLVTGVSLLDDGGKKYWRLPGPQ